MRFLLLLMLGVIQGLTEFIPISSTAHMTLYGYYAGMIDPAHPERWTATIAVVQLGTLAAALAYFARDIRSISAALIRETFFQRVPLRQQSLQARLGWMVIVGTVPIAVVGVLLKDLIEGPLTKNPIVIAVMLATVAIAMLVAERRPHARMLEHVSIKDALAIGCAQVLALVPGASRSGTTISAALFLGIERTAAARFSFLLSIPALLASGIFELVHVTPLLSEQQLLELVLATSAATLSGYVSIAFLLHYLRTHRMDVFAYYRLVLAGLLVMTIVGGLL